MAVFKLILFTSFLMIQTIDNTCGPPGTTIGADIYGHTSTADEGQTVSYSCKHQYKQVYGYERKCERGKWTPKIPKCAINESPRLLVENYKVNYYDNNEGTGYTVNKTFELFNYIMLNSSRRFTFELIYSPKARLSYVEMDLQILSESLPLNLEVSLHINDYRDCVLSSKRQSNVNSVVEFKFICEAKTDIDYETEGKDKPNSLRLLFYSKNKFCSRILRISVFRFHGECGSPDVPLNAKTIIDSGNRVSIFSLKPDRYKIMGMESDTVRCLYEGNWDKEFQSLYPITSCPFDEEYWDSLHFKNISKEYFEYFNDTLYAAVNSKIQFQCNNNQSSSAFHYLFCKEDGNWTGDVQYLDGCKEQNENNETTNGNQKIVSDDSDFFVIIVTLLSTFVTTLSLTLIFGSIIVWRKRVLKKRKLKNLSVRYVNEDYGHIFGEEITAQYETIDYQAIDLLEDNEDRPAINHYYMQILN